MFKKDVAILDIGSMCMTVLVAERGVNGTFKIKGKGEAEYGGFQKGEFLEPDQVKYAIGLAIANAETSYGTKITDVYVGVPGEFTSVICRDTVINFTRKKKINRKVKEKVVKLTDEQYGAYIMALKDEKPPVLIRKTQDE